MTKITIIQGRMFLKGASYAKRYGGTYHPATRTWTLPDTPTIQRMLNAPHLYGWSIVAPTTTQPCPRCHTYCDGDCHN